MFAARTRTFTRSRTSFLMVRMVVPGAIEIQPTILYLSTCIFGESRPNQSLRTAVLQCFKKMATHKLNAHQQWEKYLLSTLAKLLDLAKTGDYTYLSLQVLYLTICPAIWNERNGIY